MEPQPHDDASSVSLARGLRANRICDLFEAAWKTGTRPKIDEFLTGISPGEWPDLLRELLILDLHYRRQLGESPTPEAYRAEYPALQLDPFAELFAEKLQPISPSPDGGTGHSSRPDPQSPSGKLARIRYLGDYELVEEIARGGMGVVYRARQVSLNRIVAVKMILAGLLATKADHDRFHAEAQAAALLDHPNIVPIFEVGEFEGQHYFSMGYVEGQSLAARLAKGPLPPKEAAEMGATVAGAVEYAHRQGVVHRDIKPSNILIDCKGRPRVTDFGLAKRVGAPGTSGRGSDLTATGQILGTPSYMAPEQAAGQINAVGPAADVYGLGALLYAALAGRPPFQAATVLETMRQVIESEPVALRQLNPGVPRDLETIVLKCLEKSVPRRYATAQALAEDLGRYLDGRPILVRPVGRWEHSWRWCRRQPVVAGLIATIALTLVAGIVVSSLFAADSYRQAKLAKEQAEIAKSNEIQARIEKDRADGNAAAAKANALTAERKAKEAEEQKNRAEVQLLRARTAEYSIQVGLAQRDLLEGDYAEAEELLEECASDLRGWEYRYLWNTLCKRRITVFKTSGVSSVAFSPDGRRIVSGGPRGVKVWDAATGQESLTLKGAAGRIIGVAFSADGRRIVSGSYDMSVKVWDAVTGQETLTFDGLEDGAYSVAFSPDGRRIVAGGGFAAKVWDAGTGKETLTLKVNTDWIISVAFSPAGRRIVSGSRDGTVKVWDTVTGQETLTLKGHTDGVNSVAFSPDGRRIVSSSWDGTVKVWDSATGKETLTLKVNTSGVSVAFSPDSRRIVSGGSDRMVKVWDAMTGQETLAFKGHTSGISSVAFSPDGRRIVSGRWDGTVKVWEAAGDQETLTLKGHTSGVSCVAFSPDGRRIVAGGGYAAKVWDAGTGKETLTLKVNTDWINSVAFSPDGRRIVSGFNDRSVSAAEVWDAITGQQTLTLKSEAITNVAWATSVAFSPDGRWIVSGGPGGVKVWDAATGKGLLTLKGHSGWVSCAAFSPDSRRIVSGGWDKTVKVWDATTWKEALTLKGHIGLVYSVAFSPDGRRIVAGSQDSAVKVWDAATGQETLTLKGHRERVNSVAFSPDGRRIVSGGMDRTVKIWDAITGQETLSLKGHSEAVSSVAFSPDGRRIISGSGDGTVKVWDAGTGQETPEAQAAPKTGL